MEILPVLIVIFILVLYVVASIKILAEYERGVIFRLGKLLPRPKGPGVILVFAPIDRMVRVGLRTVVFDVPPQDVITRDNVSVKVSAVVYFRVIDPLKAIVEVENFNYATSQLSQTTLRSVLGQVELDDLLSQRERLNQHLQQTVRGRTASGRSASGGRRAAAILSRDAKPEGHAACRVGHPAAENSRCPPLRPRSACRQIALSQAAGVIAAEPVAITLRYLQTLTEIAAEKNSTIIFPLPIEMLHLLRQIEGVDPKR